MKTQNILCLPVRSLYFSLSLALAWAYRSISQNAMKNRSSIWDEFEEYNTIHTEKGHLSTNRIPRQTIFVQTMPLHRQNTMHSCLTKSVSSVRSFVRSSSSYFHRFMCVSYRKLNITVSLMSLLPILLAMECHWFARARLRSFVRFRASVHSIVFQVLSSVVLDF